VTQKGGELKRSDGLGGYCISVFKMSMEKSVQYSIDEVQKA